MILDYGISFPPIFLLFSDSLDKDINIDTITMYKTPWQGDPRVNIQNHKGRAKASKVKQVLRAIEKMEVDHGLEK